MNRLSRIVALGAAFTVLSAGVAMSQTLGVPAPQLASAPANAYAVELAPKVGLEVTALRRLANKGVLQMEITVTNRSDVSTSLYNLSLASHSALEGFGLIDFVGKRRYSMGTSEGVCLCSNFQNDGLVKAGESKTFWAWFAMPPADVQQMSVLIRDRSPILNVQLQ